MISDLLQQVVLADVAPPPGQVAALAVGALIVCGVIVVTAVIISIAVIKAIKYRADKDDD